MKRFECARTAALTLPEVLIASAILAGATAAVTKAVSTGHALTYDALNADRAVRLTDSMLEEVLVLPFQDPDGNSDPGPEAGELSGRDDWDNVDDAHGFTEEPGNLRDSNDVLLPDVYQRYRRVVTASATTLVMDDFGLTIPGVQVVVSVTESDSTGKTGRTWTLARFVAEPVE